MTSDTAVSTTRNNKTNSPPPAYAVLPPEPATSPQRQTPPPSPSPQGTPPSLPYHPSPTTLHPNGPTPISSHYPLLPYAYYDLPDDADERARWRFLRALMCGVGIWVIFGMIVWPRDK